LRAVQDTPRGIVVTCQTHHVTFGMKNVVDDRGGQQAYGDESRGQHQKIPARAEAGVSRLARGAVEVDEIAPYAKEIGDFR